MNFVSFAAAPLHTRGTNHRQGSFRYKDLGQGTPGHFNWHLAAFSERRLAAAMREAGLREVTRMERREVRGYDHGWINLGVKGLR